MTYASDYARLPEAFRAPLADYFERRSAPSEFVLAVLSNDLRGALTIGTDDEREAISPIVSWLYKHAPRFSWGSVATVDAWLRREDERGLEASRG
jgi:hypothetical protein